MSPADPSSETPPESSPEPTFPETGAGGGMGDAPPAGYDYLDDPFGGRSLIHLHTARICCTLYRTVIKGGGSKDMAKATAFGAYFALHPGDTTGDAVMREVNRVIAYGFKKAPWYMMGRAKPKMEQLELRWACKPPKLHRGPP